MASILLVGGLIIIGGGAWYYISENWHYISGIANQENPCPGNYPLEKGTLNINFDENLSINQINNFLKKFDLGPFPPGAYYYQLTFSNYLEKHENEKKSFEKSSIIERCITVPSAKHLGCHTIGNIEPQSIKELLSQHPALSEILYSIVPRTVEALVPEGEEIYWKNKLSKYPEVQDAQIRCQIPIEPVGFENWVAETYH